MIEFNELVNWYEKCMQIAIKEGNVPKDVTPEEAMEYMSFVYCTSKRSTE